MKEIKLNGTTVFIRGAVDLEYEKVIDVWISSGRSDLEGFSRKDRAYLRRKITPDIYRRGIMVPMGS